jgi:hypothetical protein
MTASHRHRRHGYRMSARTAPPNRGSNLTLHRYPPLPATAAHLIHHQPQAPREGTRIMLDRSQVDAVIYRVAVASFTHYLDKAEREPGYTVEEDLDWCMRPLRHLPPLERDDLRDRVLELITNPTADRQAFIRQLKALAEDA